MNDIRATFLSSSGSDLLAVNAARASLGRTSETMRPADAGLLHRLARDGHWAPFEHLTATLHICAPIYVARQIMRHRMFSYSEISLRYTRARPSAHAPEVFLSEAGVPMDYARSQIEDSDAPRRIMVDAYARAFESYSELLDAGVAKEQARAVLPVGTMTEWYMTGNLRAWMNFLHLRLDGHTQIETRTLAESVLGIVSDKFPVSVKAWQLAGSPKT